MLKDEDEVAADQGHEPCQEPSDRHHIQAPSIGKLFCDFCRTVRSSSPASMFVLKRNEGGGGLAKKFLTGLWGLKWVGTYMAAMRLAFVYQSKKALM